MFFNCYLSFKMRLLNELSVAAWLFKGRIRLSWFCTILKSIKIKFDENLTVWFKGPLLFLQVGHTKISIEEIPQLFIFLQFPFFWGFLLTLLIFTSSMLPYLYFILLNAIRQDKKKSPYKYYVKITTVTYILKTWFPNASLC